METPATSAGTSSETESAPNVVTTSENNPDPIPKTSQAASTSVVKPGANSGSDQGNYNSALLKLPKEVLCCIFKYLTPKELVKCREVCVGLHKFIQDMYGSEAAWARFCVRDHNKAWFLCTRKKARAGLSNFHLYKSMSLWSHLSRSKLAVLELTPSPLRNDIKDFKICRDCNFLGVHTTGGLSYYNIDTWEKAEHRNFIGRYHKYDEYHGVIILLDHVHHLYNIVSVLGQAFPQIDNVSKVTYGEVKYFIRVGQNVCFSTMNDEVFEYDIHSVTTVAKFLQQTTGTIISLGHLNDDYYVLTLDKEVYKVDETSLTLICTIDASTNLLNVLLKYNFVAEINWQVYYQWMDEFNHVIPEGPLMEIAIIKSYGDIYFVGSEWGVLRIYFSPYSDDEIDILNAQPAREYNLRQIFNCTRTATCPILEVDVLEDFDGAKLFVAIPKMLAVLNFVY